MAKLTRKSYKRKKVAFAAVVLGGVALVSSGFAAFVLSAGAEKNVGGGIEVGKSVKGALSMEIFNYDANAEDGKGTKLDGTTTDAYFSFDADEKDTEGKTKNKGLTGENGLKSSDPEIYSNRAYYKKKETTDKPERLSNTFIIEIKSTIDSLSSLNVKLTTSGEKKDFETPVANGFITLPECSKGVDINDFATITEPKKADNDSYLVTKTGDDKAGYTWTIKYTFAFDWGTRFNNMNPCYFFDNKATSADPLTGTKTPRTKDAAAGTGNCYGTSADALTPGWDVDINTIDADWNWLKGKVDGASYKINFAAEAK